MLLFKTQKKIYKTLFKKYNYHHYSLHWSKKEYQYKRFEILSQIDNLNNKTILDIGCGFGDFFIYLDSIDIKPKRLVGIDVVEEFIQIAKQNSKAQLICDNYLKKSFSNIDYAFSSGIFAFGNKAFFQKVVKKAFSEVNLGYGFNLFQAKSRDFFSFSIKEIEEFLYSLQPKKIKIIKNYLQNDITFYLYK